MEVPSLAPSTQIRSVVIGTPIRVRVLSFPSNIASHNPNASRSNPISHALDGDTRSSLHIPYPIRLRCLKACEASKSLSENSPLVSGGVAGRERDRIASSLEAELRDLISGDESKVDEAALISALRTCARLKKLSSGRKAHEVARKQGFHLRIDVGNALLNMYAKCGCFDEARNVLSEFPRKDIGSWNTMISGLVGHGRCQEALDLLPVIVGVDGLEPDRMTIITLLKACAKLQDPFLGMQLHGFTCKKDFRHRPDVGCSMLNMYAKCGLVDTAQQLFGEMPERNVISWTAMIAGLVDHDRCQEALDLFRCMKDGDGVEPNEKTITKVLKACALLGELSHGKELHKVAREKGFDRWTHVASALLDMYAKCGCVDTAREMFDEMPSRDLVSWNAMITALVDHDRCEEAVELFRRMRRVDGLEPDETTLTKVFQAFAFLGNSLSEAYGDDAGGQPRGLKDFQVSESLSGNWYLVSSDSARRERERAASLMEEEVWGLISGDEGRWHSANTLTSALATFANLKKLSFGRRVHEVARKKGLHLRIDVANALVHMYARCGCVDDARKVFDEMPHRCVKSWTAMISGLVNDDRCREALELFLDMRHADDVEPNDVTMIMVLKACANSEDPFLGEELHGYAIRTGLLRRMCVGNALANMYVKCGFVETAWKVFDEMPERDVISWTTMIVGLVDHDRCEEALDVFLSMKAVDGVEPNEETVTKMLKACGQLEDLSLGKKLHRFARRKGFHGLTHVANALLDMYAKCGCLETAREIFGEIPKRDLVSWNAMINALVDHDRCQEALELYRRMVEVDGFEPDHTTITKLLKACWMLRQRRLGQELHVLAMKMGLLGGTDVASSLLHMYAMSRRIDPALQVFGETREKNVTVWTAMIAGLFANGREREAFDFFLRMRDEGGVEPNQRTLDIVLDACARP